MEDDTVLGTAPEDEDIDLLDLDELEEAKFAVKLSEVSRTYKIGKRTVNALKGVSIEVFPGDFIVIYGASGSGKTTLLNIIGAIDSADSGRVLVMDVPITGVSSGQTSLKTTSCMCSHSASVGSSTVQP